MQAEGIFRINGENSQEEFVRDQLNRGIVPEGTDIHCLAGLIKVRVCSHDNVAPYLITHGAMDVRNLIYLVDNFV